MYLVAAEPLTDWRVRSHSALSSVLHAFCAFESSVNELGHLMFFLPSSAIYLSTEKRGYLLSKAVAGWNRLECIEKFILLVELLHGETIRPQTEARLRELNTLRNWIAHGFAFQSTLLLAPTATGTFDQVDREDSVNWRTKFPNQKFHPLNELDHLDAHKAIVTVIEGLLVTHRASGGALVIYSLGGRPSISEAIYPSEAEVVFQQHLAGKIPSTSHGQSSL